MIIQSIVYREPMQAPDKQHLNIWMLTYNERIIVKSRKHLALSSHWL